MSEETKAKSIEKLMGMKKKVGYPDKWKDFSTMLINRISFVKNILNANKWWFGYKMAKLTLEADRDEWGITPHEYNAYYRPPNNEVVIAASVVLIPGFTDKQIDDAVAYGYAGASTIGHEMTHGFDIGGRQYDVNGNLRQWWTTEDSVKFVKKTKPLIEQYNEYVVIDSLNCNGEATLDENIADLGGVVLALRAFKKTQQYNEGKLIAGYTPLQRFFMGYALAWMNQYTKESLIQKVLADEHAPPKMRINCVLENIPEFYEAFNVKPCNKMWRAPEKRVKIW
jgi:putative endopeptidase